MKPHADAQNELKQISKNYKYYKNNFISKNFEKRRIHRLNELTEKLVRRLPTMSIVDNMTNLILEEKENVQTRKDFEGQIGANRLLLQKVEKNPNRLYDEFSQAVRKVGYEDLAEELSSDGQGSLRGEDDEFNEEEAESQIQSNNDEQTFEITPHSAIEAFKAQDNHLPDKQTMAVLKFISSHIRFFLLLLILYFLITFTFMMCAGVFMYKAICQRSCHDTYHTVCNKSKFQKELQENELKNYTTNISKKTKVINKILTTSSPLDNCDVPVRNNSEHHIEVQEFLTEKSHTPESRE